MSDMLKKLLAKEPANYELLDQAFVVINDDKLTFAKKMFKVNELEEQATGEERSLFGDVYSALHAMLDSEDDIKTVSGVK